MTDPVSIIILLGGFALLMLLKVPVAFALALSAFASAYNFGGGTTFLEINRVKKLIK